MEELIGKTIARYKILALLGEGGMGAVFKAHDLTLQRDVAIKLMHEHFARLSDFKERFLQEARVTAHLDHPCIVQVFDFGQTNSMLYIVMKYIPGDNLSKMLQELQKQGKWIDLSEAVLMVRQIAQALHYAHQQGILHRDIKPGNIMIEPVPSDGLPYRPVLTDLGLAKLVGSQGITQEGSSMGTPAYMSPEQALGQTLDARSDVYSLGILLYEMSTGRLPFPARTLTEAIRYHTQEAPPPPRSIQPALPEALEKVILKALEKKPGDRYPDAAAFAQALVNVLPADKDLTAGPTAFAGNVSLITQYQQSLSASRGPSILQDFAAPKDTNQDRVQILLQDRTTQTVAMKTGGLTIGRDDDNDIVIPKPSVSRHHARIDFDGLHYRVLDLDSTNGTFFDGVRLLPGMPEEWTPGKVLKVGDAYLRILLSSKKGAASVFRTDGSRVEPGQVFTSPGAGNLGIHLETPQVSVNPGQSVTLPVSVVNQGDIVDHVRIALEGVPAPWVSIQPSSLQLMPGMQQNATVLIQPTRTAQSRAGRYPITVRAISQSNQSQVAEVKGTLTLMPYIQFSSELQPQRIRAGATGRVTVRNQGNLQETFSLVWKDRADELAFKPQQTRLNIPAGQESIAEFQAAPRHKIWIGGERIYPISVQVGASQGESQTQVGEVASRGLLPAWLLLAMIFFCLLVSAAGALIYRNYTIEAEKTAQAAIAIETTRQLGAIQAGYLAATQTASVIHQAEVAATQTAHQAELATAQAETATSAALSVTPLPSMTPTSTHTPRPTSTPTASPSPTSTPTETPAPPPDGVSLNCDGTYQRFQISDAGSLGKTITIDNWTGSSWVTVFTLSSGDPMERQFADETGLYAFGGCQKLVVIPLRIGRVLQLAIYAWNGTGLTQVFYREEGSGSWRKENKGLVFSMPLYLFGEPVCCPCYMQEIGYTWNGKKFVEGAAVKLPTFSGTPPAGCGP
jgi:serine/threonine protein kinase